MEMQAKLELVNLLRDRYRLARKKDKSKILDEFVAITGHHRKHSDSRRVRNPNEFVGA